MTVFLCTAYTPGCRHVLFAAVALCADCAGVVAAGVVAAHATAGARAGSGAAAVPVAAVCAAAVAGTRAATLLDLPARTGAGGVPCRHAAGAGPGALAVQCHGACWCWAAPCCWPPNAIRRPAPLRSPRPLPVHPMCKKHGLATPHTGHGALQAPKLFALTLLR